MPTHSFLSLPIEKESLFVFLIQSALLVSESEESPMKRRASYQRAPGQQAIPLHTQNLQPLTVQRLTLRAFPPFQSQHPTGF